MITDSLLKKKQIAQGLSIVFKSRLPYYGKIRTLASKFHGKKTDYTS